MNYNVSFGSSLIYNEVFLFNVSFSNTVVFNQVFLWNISYGNTSLWYDMGNMNWNCSFSNSTPLEPGTNYYVSNSGLDSNDGLTISTPWENASKVDSELNAGVINQGDNIYFNRGDSWSDSKINLRLGGNVSNYMVFGAYGSGVKPVLTYSADNMFEEDNSLVGGGYIRFENLNISDCNTKLGIKIVPGVAGFVYNLTVTNCDFYTECHKGQKKIKELSKGCCWDWRRREF